MSTVKLLVYELIPIRSLPHSCKEQKLMFLPLKMLVLQCKDFLYAFSSIELQLMKLVSFQISLCLVFNQSVIKNQQLLFLLSSIFVIAFFNKSFMLFCCVTEIKQLFSKCNGIVRALNSKLKGHVIKSNSHQKIYKKF